MTRSSLNRSHFPPHRSFSSLTLHELLRARSAWHIPLSNMHGVIGTAIGLYRFRPNDKTRGSLERNSSSEPRTFRNSRILSKLSWPCILVLVSEWIPLKRFHEDKKSIVSAEDPAQNSTHLVPQFLHTKEGLAVPTCVIEVAPDTTPEPDITTCELFFQSDRCGGGSPLIITGQGLTRAGTVACLTTDHHVKYALTCAHVSGPGGQPINTLRHTSEVRVGESAGRQVISVPFSQLYPAWGDVEGEIRIDAGLVKIDDYTEWTSQAYGIGDLEAPVDINTSNLNLTWLGLDLSMANARSKVATGAILGLFPRFLTRGGIDLMADLLIGPVPDKSVPFDPGPGSSGGLWIRDVNEQGKTTHVPVALNWGRMDLHDGSGEYPLALATHITNVLSLLGVDIETAYGTGTGTAPVWAGLRHVNIADVAWDVLGKFDRNIGDFFGGKKTGKDRETLQELAKVPDYWSQPFKGGGWYRASEGPNHYSNIDLKVDNDLLMDEKVTKAAWLAFYAKAGKTAKLGALPFRIAQVYKNMCESLKKRQSGKGPDYDKFYRAAGTLLHYASDACNPAHISRYGTGREGWGKYHSVWDNAEFDHATAVTGVKAQSCKADWAGNGLNEIAAEVLATMKAVMNLINVTQFTEDNSDVEAECVNAAKAFVRTPKTKKDLGKCVALGVSLWCSLVSSAVFAAGLKKLPAPNLAWGKSQIDKCKVKTFLTSNLLRDY